MRRRARERVAPRGIREAPRPDRDVSKAEVHSERRDGGARRAPRAQDERPGPRGPAVRPGQAHDLGGERGGIGVVRDDPSVVAADQRIGGAGHARARVEVVDEREHALLVGHGHVEAVVGAVAQARDGVRKLAGRHAHRLVGVRQPEGAQGRAVHHGALRVPDRVADDGEASRLHDRSLLAPSGVLADSTGSSASTRSTRASSRASRTRTWIVCPGTTSPPERTARPSSRVAIA